MSSPVDKEVARVVNESCPRWSRAISDFLEGLAKWLQSNQTLKTLPDLLGDQFMQEINRLLAIMTRSATELCQKLAAEVVPRLVAGAEMRWVGDGWGALISPAQRLTEHLDEDKVAGATVTTWTGPAQQRYSRSVDAQQEYSGALDNLFPKVRDLFHGLSSSLEQRDAAFTMAIVHVSLALAALLAALVTIETVVAAIAFAIGAIREAVAAVDQFVDVTTVVGSAGAMSMKDLNDTIEQIPTDGWPKGPF